MNTEKELLVKDKLFCFVKKHTVYNAMLFIKDIYKLSMWQGIAFHSYMPVKDFTVIGVVIEVHMRDKVLYLRVHDGTASIKCVFFLEEVKKDEEKQTNRKWTKEFGDKKCLMAMLERSRSSLLTNRELELGSLVHVRGYVKQSDNNTELICNKIRELNPNDEALYKFLRVQLYERFYSMNIDWFRMFLDYLKGNPGILAVKYLRDMHQSSFTVLDLVNLRCPIINESSLQMTLKDMKDSGFMFKKDGDIFQIVEYDQDLQEIVFNLVKEESHKCDKSINSRHVFIHLKLRYPDISLDNVKHCLRVLEDKSYIYSTTDKEHFRVV